MVLRLSGCAALPALQLTHLALAGAVDVWDPQFSLSPLASLTNLQALRLRSFTLEPSGLVALSHACTALTQLRINQVWLLPLPNNPSTTQPQCAWPALAEMEITDMVEGLIGHVLPNRAAAPRLQRLLPPHSRQEVDSGLNYASLKVRGLYLKSHVVYAVSMHCGKVWA